MVTSPTFKFTHSTDGSVTLVGDPGNTKITTTSTLVGAAVGVGPTGSSYSKKLHVRGSGSTDTTPQSGNGLNGAALGEGVVIHNSGAGSSSTGLYANLDFRAYDADGRIAYVKTGSDAGEFQIITEKSSNSFVPALTVGSTGDVTMTGDAASDTWLKINAQEAQGVQGIQFWKTDASGSGWKWKMFNTNAVGTGGHDFHIEECRGLGVKITAGSTSWSSASDERLKRDWTLLTNATHKLRQLTKVGTYEMLSRSGESLANGIRLVGVSAQEVQKVLPEAVSTDAGGYLSLRYQDLMVLGLRATQELSDEVVTLRQTNARLEEANARLEAQMAALLTRVVALEAK